MKYKVSLNGKDYLVEVERGEARMLSITDTPVVTTASVPTVMTEATTPSSVSPSVPAAESISDGLKVIAPMPGSVIEVSVNIGDQVQKDQKICVIEAMKMENEIVAPKAGTVKQICIETGVKVETSQILIVLA